MSVNYSPPANEGDTECGFFCWKGGSWQIFTSTKVYVLVYGLIGLVHFALGSYEVAIITTIEKRFKIPSRTTGLIMSSWDIGSLICLVLLTYLGSKGHKPRWVAVGTFVIAISSAIMSLPHLIYGPGTFDNSTYDTTLNSKCELGAVSDEVCTEGEESRLSSIILFIANTLLGIGTCVYYTLGIAYLDDNARKNKMPLLLAGIMAIRMIGPTLGFMLGSYALSIYIDPTINPGITSDDPRWVGAWWIGFVPIGISSIFLTLFIWPFPRHLPRAYNRKIEAGIKFDDTQTSFKDFKLMMKRLVKNKVLMYNTVSATLYMFGMMGYWTFMPKYLETQFQQSASQASFITGAVGLICTALGVLTSGLVITHFKPSPQSLALWNVIVEAIDVIGHLSYAYLGCPTENLQGHWESEGWSLAESCNSFCSCPPNIKYNPLCAQDGSVLFYSPCHAGCPTGSFNTTLKVYQNCSCLPDIPIVPGPCPLQCATKFNIFIAILCIMSYFSATGRAGNTIIQFRSVSEDDKAVSIGLTEAFLSTFAFIPAPIFYGALLDYGCLVWGTLCGEQGNCWLYDGRSVRYYMNFTASFFILLATLADVGVWKYSYGLEIYEEEGKEPQELQPLDSKPPEKPIEIEK
ncbi:solute carrier organic anion transporter family member 74D isoform X3 [Halyomorpha halys]|uniref:solute carrier organic anion transporter family member 74D isoform X3 n=1 Tax=Halyomorpha halys TaxID=286706 RepID=UPI0006D50B5A